MAEAGRETIDVGTCVTDGAWPDTSLADVAGHPRTACDLDTPSLTGVASSPPYLHDGSAPTLRDVLERTRGHMGDISDIVGAILYLETASFVTGEIIHVDGGQVAGH